MLIDLKWDAAEVTVVIMAGIPTFLSVECKWAAKLKELKVYPTDLITVQSVFFLNILDFLGMHKWKYIWDGTPTVM